MEIFTYLVNKLGVSSVKKMTSFYPILVNIFISTYNKTTQVIYPFFNFWVLFTKGHTFLGGMNILFKMQTS